MANIFPNTREDRTKIYSGEENVNMKNFENMNKGNFSNAFIKLFSKSLILKMSKD